MTQGIGTAGATGIVTFFSVSGDLSNIRTNDRFKVGVSTETVKILEVDEFSSRLRVLRPVEAVGVSHTSSTILEEIPRVFTFQTSLARTPRNKEDLENEGVFPTTEEYEIYFNPSESIGTSHSNPDNETGIGNTITISNPGAGDSTRIIPRGSIFLPNHNLLTGDAVSYTHLTLPTNREV